MKIDKGIPVPGVKGHPKYPFRDMEVGDSFFILADGKEKISLRSAANKHREIHPSFDYVTRSEGTGIRLWRVEVVKTK